MFGDLDDPESEIAKLCAALETEDYHPEYGAMPRVKYVGIPRRLVAGEVVLEGTDSCAEGIKVTLEGEGGVRETTTDTFGDFEFEGVEKNRAYTLRVESPGYGSRSFEIKTHTDVDLGEIVLTAGG